MATESVVTQRSFLTGARLRISRLQLDGDLEGLFRQLAEISAQALKVARAGVWLFDASFETLTCKLQFGEKADDLPAPLLISKHPNYLKAIREQRFVAVNDAQHDPITHELLDYLEARGVTSLLDSAVYRNGVVVGIMCHEHTGPLREWKKEEGQFAATVADLLAQFLEVNDRIAAETTAHELELKLKDAQRINAMGRMATGVAHDLNNLLGVITNGIEVLRRGADGGVLQSIDDSARHAAALIARLMAFGNKQTPVPVVQPLDPVLSDVQAVLAGQIKPGSRLVLDSEKGLTIWADASQLSQVLINLALNGFQAMPKGGVVVLRAHARHGGVDFEVIDTGTGIAEVNLEKLFDPFFSTRPEGHGIGLAVVEQLVHHHGVEISVTSTQGDGTTFKVWWPSEILE